MELLGEIDNAAECTGAMSPYLMVSGETGPERPFLSSSLRCAYCTLAVSNMKID